MYPVSWSADPRIIKNPEVIDTITYTELRELAYMGATVLHEDAIFPVRQRGYPDQHPQYQRVRRIHGTLIVESTCRKPRYTITGIAGKKGFVAINIEKDMMNSEIGFCRKVLTGIRRQWYLHRAYAFRNRYHDRIRTSVRIRRDRADSVLAGIHRAVNPDSVDLESDLALIAVVGRGMKAHAWNSGTYFLRTGTCKYQCQDDRSGFQ